MGGGRTDRRTERTKSPYSIGHRPLRGRCPKKGRLGYNLRMREAFEIRRHDSGPGKGLNEDNGAYLKTDIWDPVLKTLTQ